MKPILTVTVYKSRSKNPKQLWRWTAKAANGRKVANSGEGYARATDAVGMAGRLFTAAFDVDIIKEGKGK